MLIVEGSAEEISKWFITQKTDETILCIFLGTAQSHIDLLATLINRVEQVDAVIGEKIGFLVCTKGQLTAKYLESKPDLKPTRLVAEKRSIPAREYLLQFDTISLRSEPRVAQSEHEANALSACTARMMPDFMRTFGIHHKDLPCMLTLVKGVDSASVSSFPEHVTKEALLRWLSDLRDLVDRVESDLLNRDFTVEDVLWRLQSARNFADEAKAKLLQINKAAQGVCAKFSSDVDTVFRTVTALSSEHLNSHEKAKVIAEFVAQFPESARDQRWAKVTKLQERIDELDKLSIQSLDREATKDISEKLKDELQRVEQIYEGIQQIGFADSKSSTSSVSLRGSQIWGAAERVNTAHDIIQKLNKALLLLSGLF